MKGTAVNKLEQKIWAVFGLGTATKMITQPEDIEQILNITELPDWCHILPWYGELFDIDFKGDLSQLRPVLEKMVENVESCDPWVKEVFGVEGTGEGVVLYPIGDDFIAREPLSSYLFKAKGEKHKVKSTKQKVEIAPEVAQSISDFVSTFVTEARLEQCLAEVGAEDRMPEHTGKVIKWMNQDILKESVQELEEAGLTWKKVASAVSARTRTMYLTDSF